MRGRPLLRQLKSAFAFLARPLPERFEEISFILVDRETIKRVHLDFLNDPTETDVITFPYGDKGEILVCPAVARDRVGSGRERIEEEVLLYALHGLLHLVGYDDTTPAESRKMVLAQNRLVKRVLIGR